MGSRNAPESLHSVTLSACGQSYTAKIWRGGPTQWRLLAVEISGDPIPGVERRDFASCRASLEAAECAVLVVLSERAPVQRGAA